VAAAVAPAACCASRKSFNIIAAVKPGA